MKVVLQIRLIFIISSLKADHGFHTALLIPLAFEAVLIYNYTGPIFLYLKSHANN